MDWTGKILDITDEGHRVTFLISKNSTMSETVIASVPEIEDQATIMDLAMWAYGQISKDVPDNEEGAVRERRKGYILKIDNHFEDRVDFWIALADDLSATYIASLPALISDMTIGELRRWAIGLAEQLTHIPEQCTVPITEGVDGEI